MSTHRMLEVERRDWDNLPLRQLEQRAQGFGAKLATSSKDSIDELLEPSSVIAWYQTQRSLWSH
jgi:hypothetical protein